MRKIILRSPAAWLGEMEAFTGRPVNCKVQRDGEYSGNFVSNNQETFDRYCYPQDASWATYLLKGQYKTFTGTLYIPETSKNMYGENRILVYLDDKLVYTSEPVGAGMEPIPFSINVNGAYKMEIVVQVGLIRTVSTDFDWYTSLKESAYNRRDYCTFNAQIGNAALWTD